MLGIAPSPKVEAASRLHPAVLQAAAKQPDAKINVIVQKAVKDDSVEKLVSRLGGEVTSDLHIINAFGAKMPAISLNELAKADGVRWVSLDGAMQSSTVNYFDTWATETGSNVTTSLTNNFNTTPILAERTLWLSSVLKVSNLDNMTRTVTLNFDYSTLSINISGTIFTQDVPAATVIYSPTATNATTVYDAVNGKWVTTVPMSQDNTNVFLSGVSLKVPMAVPGSLSGVTWSGRFMSDTPGVSVTAWKWAAAVYTTFNKDYNVIGVKATDSSTFTPYLNSDKAGTPENYKTYVTAGATGTGGTNYVGAYSSNGSVIPAAFFRDPDKILDAADGPNGTYGGGGVVNGSFTGFAAEANPSRRIMRVEAMFKAYVPQMLSGNGKPVFKLYAGGQLVRSVTLNENTFDVSVGQGNASVFYVDLTGTRTWRWSDFDDNLQLVIDHSRFGPNDYINYDAVGLHISTDNGNDTSGSTMNPTDLKKMYDTSKLNNAYGRAVRATDVWNSAPFRQGQNMTIAVVDSGIYKTKDLSKRVKFGANFNPEVHTAADGYGHGTFVAGLIAGDGKLSDGAFVGVAPKANLINIRVCDDNGMATESSVVSGLQWIYENKALYNIKVVNMSLNAATPQSYHTSPMSAAAEVLWFSGIVVVASAGNNGTANLYAPANDPFIITVGATDDRGTTTLSDDIMPSYSAYGTDQAGQRKPDLVAPGTRIIGLLPQNNSLTISQNYSANRVNFNYFKMSGTSMAAPIVAGAAALVLQANPNLTPDQVKYRLKATANANWPGYIATRSGAGYLDIYAAVNGTTTQSANTGLQASQMLWTGSDPVNWGSVNWGSVNWGSVNWGSVNWGSVNWGSVNWASDYWGQ